MKTNLKKVIDRLNRRVNFHSVLNEAVVNSIQANATEINITVMRDDREQTLLDEIPYIKSVKIADDGEGFHKANRDSFSIYRSDYKANLGCKGVGRITYLKVFRSAQITSDVANENSRVKLQFTENFNESDFLIYPNHTVSVNWPPF